MYSIRKTLFLSFLGLQVALFSIITTPFPSSAVLPPGANESLAAEAPVILIGKVKEMADDSGRKLAVFQVMEVARGGIEPGAILKVELARPPKKQIVGPHVIYHEMTQGQTWLLFLRSPYKKVAPYYTLASNGYYSQHLDKIPDTAALLALLPQAENQEMAQALATLREIYQGAGAWLERNLK